MLVRARIIGINVPEINSIAMNIFISFLINSFVDFFMMVDCIFNRWKWQMIHSV